MSLEQAGGQSSDGQHVVTSPAARDGNGSEPVSLPHNAVGGENTPSWANLRIAVCLSHFSPAIGGAERQLGMLARRWVELGHDVHVFTRRRSDAPSLAMDQGVQIHRVIRTIEGGALFGASFIASLTKSLLAHRRKYDVLLAGQLPWESVATGLISRALGRPAIARVASVGVNGDVAQIQNARGTGCLMWAIRGHHSYVVPNAPARGELRSLGIRDEQILQIKNGVDLSVYRPSTTEDPRRDRTVLFVGRLTEAKNPLAVLRAWNLLPPGHDYRLLVAGEGPLRGDLEAYARQQRLAGVHFLGECRGMNEVYAQASILVVTSPSEGCSNALLEGMACGLCPIVSQVTGNVEVVDNARSGWQVPLDDDQALAIVIRRLVENPAERASIGLAASQYASENHDVTRTADEYLSVFERAVHARRRATR